ncbi:hypothetical protein HYU40_01750 [Candidatus Woesearchaeota archaeon]|nr:hypothetical protein [Candidatus Woesearchaeota archaeon]
MKLGKHAFFAFLIGLLVLLPYITLINTDLHEKAHLKFYQKHNICGTYSANYLTAIPDFYVKAFKGPTALGTATFCNNISKENYLSLDSSAKKEINLAGINSDIIFSRYLIMTAIFFASVSIAVIIGIKESYQKQTALIYLSFIILWLLVVVFSTEVNISFNLNIQGGDLQLLIYLLECGKNCTGM